MVQIKMVQKIGMMEYLQDKVNRFCNDKKERNVDVTMYDVSQEFVDDWWNVTAVLYGTWLSENSGDLETKEFSQTEW